MNEKSCFTSESQRRPTACNKNGDKNSFILNFVYFFHHSVIFYNRWEPILPLQNLKPILSWCSTAQRLHFSPIILNWKFGRLLVSSLIKIIDVAHLLLLSISLFRCPEYCAAQLKFKTSEAALSLSRLSRSAPDHWHFFPS